MAYIVTCSAWVPFGPKSWHVCVARTPHELHTCHCGAVWTPMGTYVSLPAWDASCVIEVIRVVQTCTACPSQWDAWTPTGEYVYVRYRHGWLSVDVDGVEKFGMHHGHHLDGCMTWEEVLALTPIVQR